MADDRGQPAEQEQEREAQRAQPGPEPGEEQSARAADRREPRRGAPAARNRRCSATRARPTRSADAGRCPRRSAARGRRRGPDAGGSPRTGCEPRPSRRPEATRDLGRRRRGRGRRPSATTTRCTRSSSAAKPAAGGGSEITAALRAPARVGGSVMNAAASGPSSRTVITTSYPSLETSNDFTRRTRPPGRSDLKRDAPGARVLGDGGREAQALEIHGGPGPRRLSRACGGSSAPVNRTEVPDARVGLRAGGMAGAPGHGAAPSSANTSSSRSVVDADAVGAGLVGRDGAERPRRRAGAGRRRSGPRPSHQR